jgi:hypothetical protein
MQTIIIIKSTDVTWKSASVVPSSSIIGQRKRSKYRRKRVCFLRKKMKVCGPLVGGARRLFAQPSDRVIEPHRGFAQFALLQGGAVAKEYRKVVVT